MGENFSKIAIITNDQVANHSGSWTPAWVDFCKSAGLDFNIFSKDNINIIDDIRGYDVLLWHFSGFSLQDMLMARSILYSAKTMGLKVFPDFAESWHFDDKLAESYMLQAVKAPTPQFFIFYRMDSLIEWVENNPRYPVVAKLKNGSGSHNVKLLNNRDEVINYGRRMFHKGFHSSPSLIFKAKSNIQSAKTISSFINRAKRIPEFLHTLKSSYEFPAERGYVLLQEFVPNDGYDIKIVVIGDKLSFIVRNARKGDFRASGSGNFIFEKSYLNKNILDSAFATSDALKFKCMGYDYVVDNRSKEGKIVEISYGFSHTALIQAGGYFDRKKNWYNDPLNAPKEILKNLLGAL